MISLHTLSPSRAYDIVRDAGEAAGLSRRVTPLTLRHTVATLLSENGMSLQGVSEILGHSSQEITRRYIDRSPGKQAVWEALVNSRLRRIWDEIAAIQGADQPDTLADTREKATGSDA